jgi:hypothetical protein
MGVGSYVLRFLGNPAAIAVGSTNDGTSCGAGVTCEDAVSFSPDGGGQWNVTVFATSGPAPVDVGFNVIVP